MHPLLLLHQPGRATAVPQQQAAEMCQTLQVTAE
jgi:hypothetical protein